MDTLGAGFLPFLERLSLSRRLLAQPHPSILRLQCYNKGCGLHEAKLAFHADTLNGQKSTEHAKEKIMYF